MLKLFFALLLVTPFSSTFAQTKFNRVIKCQSPLVSLSVDVKSCQISGMSPICKTTVVIKKQKTINTGLYVFLKNLPQTSHETLMLTTDDRDQNSISFSGAFDRGSFVGETHVKVKGFEVTEAMLCQNL